MSHTFQCFPLLPCHNICLVCTASCVHVHSVAHYYQGWHSTKFNSDLWRDSLLSVHKWIPSYKRLKSLTAAKRVGIQSRSQSGWVYKSMKTLGLGINTTNSQTNQNEMEEKGERKRCSFHVELQMNTLTLNRNGILIHLKFMILFFSCLTFLDPPSRC